MEVLIYRLKEAWASIFVRRIADKYCRDEEEYGEFYGEHPFILNDEGTKLFICDIGTYIIQEHYDDDGIPYYFEFEEEDEEEEE